MVRVRALFRHRPAACVVALALTAIPITLSTASPAWAQSDEDRAGARAAASEGLHAFEAKRWADALDLFTRAESLVHAPPHLLYMARANQQLGHLVRARELYLRIRSENVTPDKPKAFQDAKADAETELAAIDPVIPYVKIVVQGAGGKPFSVTVDGASMTTALVGVSRPIDPGDHKFQASADGMRSALLSLSFARGSSQTVTLDLKPAPEAVAAPPPAPATAPPPAASAPSPVAAAANPQPTKAPAAATAPTPAESSPPNTPPPEGGAGAGGTMRTLAYVGFGVAAVGIGAGVLFEVLGAGKESDANKLCTQVGSTWYCGTDPTNQSTVTSDDNAAKTDKTLGVVGFVVGGAALATGITLLVAGGGHGDENPAATSPTSVQPRPSIQPWIGIGSAGLSGTF